MAELIRFGVSVESDLLDRFDQLTNVQGYETRSEALRDLMREAIIKAKIDELSDTDEVIGSLTLIYDHHASNLQNEMTSIQHRHHELISSVMHQHINHDDCLEILALRGVMSEIVSLSNALISLKGIKNGKLFLTLPSSAITHDH